VVVEALDASLPLQQVEALRGTSRAAVQQALHSRELAAAVAGVVRAYSGLAPGLKALTQQAVAEKLQVGGGHPQGPRACHLRPPPPARAPLQLGGRGGGGRQR
jgi:hypothetical protein